MFLEKELGNDSMHEVASTTPEVSVVLGVYNGERDLKGTMGSLLSQTGCEFEVVAVNDGSRDDSGEILEELARKDGRIRVIHQENQGLTKALIRGCAAARGTYIARMDAGDVSLPGRLSRQTKALRGAPDLAFVSCGSRFVGPNGEFLFESTGSGIASAPTAILDAGHDKGVVDGPSSHPSVMFRRDKYGEVGGYRPEFCLAQDWDLWYRLATVGKFQMLPEILVEIQWGVDSISANRKRDQDELAMLARKSVDRRLAGRSDVDLLREAKTISQSGYRKSHWLASGAHYFVGECLRRNGDMATAKKYFLRSLRTNPFNAKSWIRLIQAFLSG